MTSNSDGSDPIITGDGDDASPPSDAPRHRLTFDDRARFQTTKTALWSLLADPDTLLACIPGLEAIEEGSGDTYTCTIIQSISGITHLTLSMDGTFEVAERDPPDTLLLRGVAHDAGSASELDIIASIQLKQGPGDTVDLAYAAEVAVQSRNMSLTPDVLAPTVEDSLDTAIDNIRTVLSERMDNHE